MSLGRLPLAPLLVSEHRHVLMVFDLLAVNGALFLSLSLRPGADSSRRLLIAHPLWFVLLSALWILLALAFDAYEPRMAARLRAGAPAVAKAGAVTSAIYLLVPYVTPPLPPSRLALLSFPALLIAALLAARLVYALVLPTPAFQRRALIIGPKKAARAIAQVIREHGLNSYQVTMCIDEDHRAVEDLAVRHGATTLVLCREQGLDAALLQALISCAERGIEVIPMAALYEQLTGRVLVERVGETWFVALPVYPPGISVLWNIAKRMMDVCIAGLGLACLALALPLIALAIYIESPGPIFYTQARVGKGGRLFPLHKFRSMVPNAERGRARWARDHDSRVTRVGRILRTAHLDELPQFLNVLRGDMSLVGPRPERPQITERLAAEIPFYRLRHSVRPGMGGWGLVRQGYAGTTHDALMKLQYDLYYIKHQSLGLDVLIMLKTLGHAFAFRGR